MLGLFSHVDVALAALPRARDPARMSSRRVASAALRAHAPWRSPLSCFAATRALAASASGTNTVDPRETAAAADAALWWDETRGPFAPLHAMNPTRCAFVRDVPTRHFRGSEKHADVGADPARPLAGPRLPTGAAAASRASRRRMGADVTGVDAAAANVAIAKTHVSVDPALVGKIPTASPSRRRSRRSASLDAVLALEVIEHAATSTRLVRCLAGLTHERRGDRLELNRTARSAPSRSRSPSESRAGSRRHARVLQVPRAGRTGDAAARAASRRVRRRGCVHAAAARRGRGRDRGRGASPRTTGVNYVAYFARARRAEDRSHAPGVVEARA